MVIVKLNGGLGNQLFQYAAGLALAMKNSDILELDITGYSTDLNEKQIYRNLDITDFSITAQSASPEQIEAARNPYGIFSKAIRFSQKKILKKYYVDWHPHLLEAKGNVYLDGYFQSEKYFIGYVDRILENFSLQPHLLNQILGQQAMIQSSGVTVSLHIRRGDYVEDPKSRAHHLVCNENYYQRALVRVKSLFPDAHVFVFSDDPDWVRGNISFDGPVSFISSGKASKNLLRASQEMYLMSRCTHHILSNSSFSWWGAYLNRSKNKYVLAPDKWNQGAIPQPNILANGWISFPVLVDE